MRARWPCCIRRAERSTRRDCRLPPQRGGGAVWIQTSRKSPDGDSSLMADELRRISARRPGNIGHGRADDRRNLPETAHNWCIAAFPSSRTEIQGGVCRLVRSLVRRIWSGPEIDLYAPCVECPRQVMSLASLFRESVSDGSCLTGFGPNSLTANQRIVT